MSDLQNYQVRINSSFRTNQNQNNNISSFKITDLINIQSRKKVLLACPYANFPGTWYNITSRNNSFTLIEATNTFTGSISLPVSIPPGNYGITQFISALTTAMTAASTTAGIYNNTYSGSYNQSTGQLTITIGASGVKTFTYSFTNNGFNNFMGFNNSYSNISVPFPAQLTPPQNLNSYTSPNPVYFSPLSLYIRINALRSDSSYDTQTNNNNNILKVIPITTNGLSNIITGNGFAWEDLESQRIEITNNLFNGQINFQITDEYGNLFDFNGYEWDLILQVYYSK
jgi:hypothetical protein